MKSITVSCQFIIDMHILLASVQIYSINMNKKQISGFLNRLCSVWLKLFNQDKSKLENILF